MSRSQPLEPQPIPNLRVVIIGCSGSGKSRLAGKVHTQVGLPHLELDSVFHQPNWTPLPIQDFAKAVDGFMDAHPSWVIDGNYPAVRKRIWDRASTVLWIDLPRWRVMTQLLWRTFRRAITRKQLWNGNKERLRDILSMDPYRSVIVWAWTHHRSYKETYRELMRNKAYAHLDFNRFPSHKAAAKWLVRTIPPKKKHKKNH